MTVKEKPKIGLELLVIFTILLGAAIQLGLAWQREQIGLLRGTRVTRELIAAAGDRGERLLLQQRQREEDYAAWLQRAGERLAPSAGEKRAAWEAVPRELLLLTNPWNPLPEGFVPELNPVPGSESYEMDPRCVEAMSKMLSDCRAAGFQAAICSAYRSIGYQEYLFFNKRLRLTGEGFSWADSEAEAAKVVARPGTSEHQLGMAADLVDLHYPYLNEEQEKTEAQQWLMENSWRYGFILRYPNGTSQITGIIYEPWHYRYVGPFAKEIHDRGLTLEEYIALRRGK